MTDRNNFTDLNLVVQIFDVIVKTTKSLEGNDTTICSVWPAIIDMYKHFKNNVNQVNLQFSCIVERVIASNDEKCQHLQENIFVLALFISPNHRLVAISGEYKEGDILTMLARYAMDTKFCLEECRQIIKKAKYYIKGESPFDAKDTDPTKYWENFSNEIPLKRLASRIISIISYSASCERLFSRMKYVKNKWQNTMSEDTLTSLARIKMHLKDSKDKKAIVNKAELIANEEE